MLWPNAINRLTVFTRCNCGTYDRRLGIGSYLIGKRTFLRANSKAELRKINATLCERNLDGFSPTSASQSPRGYKRDGEPTKHLSPTRITMQEYDSKNIRHGFAEVLEVAWSMRLTALIRRLKKRWIIWGLTPGIHTQHVYLQCSSLSGGLRLSHGFDVILGAETRSWITLVKCRRDSLWACHPPRRVAYGRKLITIASESDASVDDCGIRSWRERGLCFQPHSWPSQWKYPLSTAKRIRNDGDAWWQN